MRLVVSFMLTGWMFLLGCQSDRPNSAIETSYLVEDIPLPAGLTGETGALGFFPDGRLVACFLRGEVMIYDPEDKNWEVFASGLHEPLGLMVISEKELLVMQRPELTRLVDTDQDGKADFFETVTDDFGMTGNYHEWNYGPARDREGNLYIGLNTASEYGVIMDEVRGRLDTTLVPGQPMQKYAAVPYRGWILKVTPEGVVEPFASGFRSPNGLVIDSLNRLFVTDNQGDWVGTSKLYQVEKDHFYGHPASLLWQEGWSRGDPSRLPVTLLNQMRTEACVLFPHGIMAASPTQPVVDETGGKFGPFGGQILIGEMNQERIIRVMLEEVGGQLQGACLPFLDGQGLRKGNNRLAFAPDGSLWVGQAQHGFVGDLGIQRITYTGKSPMEILQMHLLPDGFKLTFTQPVSDSLVLQPSDFHLRHYYYEYHQKYGSDQYDIQEIPVTKVEISPDRRAITLELPSIRAGYVYELTISDIWSDQRVALQNKLICYTVNATL